MQTIFRRHLARTIVLGVAAALIGCTSGGTPPASTSATPPRATYSAAAPPAVAPAPEEDVLPAILRVSVQIAVERDGAPFRWGSGVVLGPRIVRGERECLVLTAGHTVDHLAAGDQVFASLDRDRPEAQKVRASVVAAQDGANVDLAIVSIRNNTCRGASIGQSASLGAPVWVVGFPYGGELTVARGIVSQVSRADGSRPASFTIDASTSHGSSGAGVFESRTGRLIGLVEAFGTARVQIRGQASESHIDIPMPGMTYVTPVSRIDDLLRGAGIAPLLIGRQ